MTTETATKAVTGKTYQLLINGELVEPKSGETFERHNPANGEVVASCPKASPEDTDAAIQAARDAFDSGSWAKAPARQR
ncbi:MAG: aldehyde dehydrogenase family protein, partial [Chloroflexi bacterium]|nr:aldehyde dehydrogenase family protein [Chloroflexota bacterium]